MKSDTYDQAAVFSIGQMACRITIKKCDIFTQEGLKAIHCPRTLETDSRIIFRNSLIGQFMSRHEQEKDHIISQINEFADAQTTKTLNPESGRYKFPLGTVCPIEVGNERYCLCAFNEHTKRENVKDLSIADYITFWEELWVNLERLKSFNINVAVPGGNIVKVGPNEFILGQKVGVIVHTFFRSLHKNTPCKRLTICLYGDEAEGFDYHGWEMNILPYLWQMSYLPICWRVNSADVPVQRDQVGTEPLSPVGNCSEFAFDSLISDLTQILANIDRVNGKEIMQKEGRGRGGVIPIEVDTSLLGRLIAHLGDDSLVKKHFSMSNGNDYDSNCLFEILGILCEDKKIFGALNKQNVVRVCLGYTDVDQHGNFRLDSDGDLPEPWNKLGTRISALSKKIAPNYKNIRTRKFYQTILAIISTD